MGSTTTKARLFKKLATSIGLLSPEYFAKHANDLRTSVNCFYGFKIGSGVGMRKQHQLLLHRGTLSQRTLARMVRVRCLLQRLLRLFLLLGASLLMTTLNPSIFLARRGEKLGLILPQSRR